MALANVIKLIFLIVPNKIIFQSQLSLYSAEKVSIHVLVLSEEVKPGLLNIGRYNPLKKTIRLSTGAFQVVVLRMARTFRAQQRQC